ncbi:MAG: DUF835 domain-containing protein [Candidatus Thermoplasmatota archaeon]|nr:DUF835 domain-containing protein [Candidatus Thermoplasmatota archaeon]
MNEDDIEFIQILNIIKRGQKLVVQAKNSGLDTKQAEELINEAKYALKINNRETAIEYAKKCMLEVIQTKRRKDSEELRKEGALDKLTKVELRKKCVDLGVDPVGLKEELIERIKAKISEISPPGEETPKAAPESAQEPPPEITLEKKVEEDIKIAKQAEEEIRSETPPQTGPKPFDADVEASKVITGLSYLIEEQRADKIYKLFNALKKEDKVGFAISRANPKLIQRQYKVDITEFMWLTDRDLGGELRSVPPSLESIIYFIEEFIDKYPDGVVLLDGLEYLIGNNTFNPVIRFLRRLVDKISTTQCILLVSLAPETLDQSQVMLLEKDLYPLNYS